MLKKDRKFCQNYWKEQGVDKRSEVVRFGGMEKFPHGKPHPYCKIFVWCLG